MDKSMLSIGFKSVVGLDDACGEEAAA